MGELLVSGRVTRSLGHLLTMVINRLVKWMILQVPSLKLTASLHLKMDGWKTILSFYVSAYFRWQTPSFRECNMCNIGGTSFWANFIAT